MFYFLVVIIGSRVEDEYHFLMICLLYKDYMERLLNGIRNSVVNFNEINGTDQVSIYQEQLIN